MFGNRLSPGVFPEGLGSGRLPASRQPGICGHLSTGGPLPAMRLRARKLPAEPSARGHILVKRRGIHALPTRMAVVPPTISVIGTDRFALLVAATGLAMPHLVTSFTRTSHPCRGAFPLHLRAAAANHNGIVYLFGSVVNRVTRVNDGHGVKNIFGGLKNE